MLSIVVSLSIASLSEWQSAFPSSSVGSYLPNDQAVMVVLAGQLPADGTAARDAFASAVRRTPGPRAVFTHEPLGDVSALRDEEIVKHAGQYAPTVVVLRVFPQSPGALVVGSVFSGSGALISSFSTPSSAALSPNSQPLSISTVTMDAVSSTMKQERQPIERPGRRGEVERAPADDDAPRVLVSIAESKPGELRPELHRVARGTIGGYDVSVSGFVCTLPCSQEVTNPSMEYVIAGKNVMPSEPFRLSQYARSGRVDLTVKTGNSSSAVLGLMGILTGSMAVLGGSIATVYGLVAYRPYESFLGGRYTSIPHYGDTGALVGGLLTTLLGGVLIGVGVPATLAGRTTVTNEAR